MSLSALTTTVEPGSTCATATAASCAALRHVYSQSVFNDLNTSSGNIFTDIGHWLEEIINDIFQHLGEGGSIGLLILIALILLVLLVIGLRRLGSHGAARAARNEETGDLSDDPGFEWRAALAAADQGDFREAIRRGFRSSLLTLAIAGRTRVEAAWTTRELLAHVATDTGLTESLAPAARRFDIAWYSGRAVHSEDWTAARADYERLRAMSRRSRAA